jgi:hypothetical protein
MDITLFRKSLASKQGLLNEAKKSAPAAEKALQERMRLIAKEFFYDKVYRGNSMEVKDKPLLKELEALGLNDDLMVGRGSHLVLWLRYAKKHNVPADALLAQLLDWHHMGLASYESKEAKALKAAGYSEDDMIKALMNMPEVKNGKSI